MRQPAEVSPWRPNLEPMRSPGWLHRADDLRRAPLELSDWVTCAIPRRSRLRAGRSRSRWRTRAAQSRRRRSSGAVPGGVGHSPSGATPGTALRSGSLAGTTSHPSCFAMFASCRVGVGSRARITELPASSFATSCATTGPTAGVVATSLPGRGSLSNTARYRSTSIRSA